MKVTYNWLKDFVDIKIAPKILADKLTMAGLEVVSLENKDGDFIFEIEITSNRPDWLSIIGIAREVATITNKKLKVTRHTPHATRKNVQGARCNVQPFSIKVENKKDCSLYTAKIIKDVKVGPSPSWLKKRLELIGCRSVNNIVDITNYVLFAWGEPLHAFDLDKLEPSGIIVRRGKKDERITTIDGEQKIVDADILLIADKEKPQAIAGVMGGKDTEVAYNTKNILLEAAIFNPVVIRRARRKLGMQTESSYRFERGIDAQTLENASWEAVKLIQELAGGKYILAKVAGATKTKKKIIHLDRPAVSKILGITIPIPKIKGILSNLGFKVRSRMKDNLIVEVPAHRQDVNLEIDLIEEITRIYGYEHIPKTLPKVTPGIVLKTTRQKVCLIKNILTGAGLNEVITYSLMDKALLRYLGRRELNPIEIVNPLSQEQGCLRPTILANLLKCVAYNLNQKQEYINIFEIAKTFSVTAESTPKEELVLGIALCGTKSWLLNQGRVKEEVGILDLKGIFEVLFERVGVKDYNFKLESPSEAAIYLGKNKAGVMLELQKSVLEKFEIKNKNVAAAEISLEMLLAGMDLKKKFIGLPKYPGISRDISLILKEEIPAGDILETIKAQAGPLLKEIVIRDYYRGKQIPAGFKGLTISCLYRSDERTLTEGQVQPIHSSVSQTIIARFDARIR